MATVVLLEDGASSFQSTENDVEYTYPLLDRFKDSIRLLEILPHHDDNDTTSLVKCTLTTITFSENPNYEALSYVWGTDFPTETLLLDGVKIRVRKNLHLALRSLRHKNKSRVLWVDALCIDQQNLEERKNQVGIMDYIFMRASCVLIWLGWHPPGIASDFGQDRGTGSIENVKFHQWVIEHAYWRRVWIVQEVALSANLKINVADDWENWDDFTARALYTQERHSDTSNNVIKKLYKESGQYIRNLDIKRRGRHGDENRLEALLEDFLYAECSEPRDHIFGFLGLAHDCDDDSIQADYSKPLFEVYQDVMAFFDRQHLGTEANNNTLDSEMRLARSSYLVQYLLGQDITPPRHLSTYRIASNNHIRLKGFLLGKIVHLGPTYQEMISSSAANKKWLSSFKRHYLEPADVKFLREATEAYMPLLWNMKKEDVEKVRQVSPNGTPSVAEITVDRWTERSTKHSKKKGSRRVHTNSVFDTDDNQVSDPNWSTAQRMLLCEGRYIGLAPPGAQVGDTICLFWHCPGGALLRLCSSSEVEGSADPAIVSEKYHVVGRVDIATGWLEDLKPKRSKWISGPEGNLAVRLHTDIETLAIITSPIFPKADHV